jgi:hypothetical protein
MHLAGFSLIGWSSTPGAACSVVEQRIMLPYDLDNEQITGVIVTRMSSTLTTSPLID